jgi:hypothetical protein
MLREYDISPPSAQDIPDFETRLAAMVQLVLDAAERGLIPGGQYDAVLIDEAHDFEPQWLALAAKMGSAITPGPGAKFQPSSPMNQLTTLREIIPSSPFSLRKMRVRWAQGQASDT